jgi:hypothetical protein
MHNVVPVDNPLNRLSSRSVSFECQEIKESLRQFPQGARVQQFSFDGKIERSKGTKDGPSTCPAAQRRVSEFKGLSAPYAMLPDWPQHRPSWAGTQGVSAAKHATRVPRHI